ncbi:hypothetical protein TNCV_4890131 [Trichonephila clavipes]|nr:hypothetical protein TNCV_4890131 [Trichonephila clavipes]
MGYSEFGSSLRSIENFPANRYIIKQRQKKNYRPLNKQKLANVMEVETSTASYFHRLYVNFSNCSTICGGLFWPRIKLFWIPLFGFNHFESPKTQQLVSEVGLNANNKSDGGPVPDSSRKIDRQHECQYGRNEIELTGMNANMEMKSE